MFNTIASRLAAKLPSAKEPLVLNHLFDYPTRESVDTYRNNLTRLDRLWHGFNWGLGYVQAPVLEWMARQAMEQKKWSKAMYCYDSAGAAWEYCGDYDRAYAACGQAVCLAEENNRSSDLYALQKSRAGVALAAGHSAYLFSQPSDVETAVLWYERAVEALDNKNFKHVIPNVRRRIAQIQR